MFICIPMVAEMAEYAFSARFPNVFHLRVDCGDDGICVSSVDAHCVFDNPMVAEMAEYGFQRGSPMCACFVPVAEMAEFAFSARMRIAFWVYDVY